MPKSVTNYWWKSCSQCRDTRAALVAGGADIADRDFFKDPFTREELQNLAGSMGLATIFNPKSPSVKKLGLDPATMTDEQMLAEMIREPRLIKRPLVVVEGKLHIQPRPKDVPAII